MEIFWMGQSCFKIKGKNTTLITDPFDPEMLGIKFPKTEAEIIIVSHQHRDHNFVDGITGSRFTVSSPGEYEIGGVGIIGVGTDHDSKNGEERGKNTIYQINVDGLTLCHLGDLGHKLNEDQREAMNGVDILMIPVGGVYTIDAEAAVEVVAQLEPRIILPMHYRIEGLKVELDGVEKFLKAMGVENVAPIPKLVITKDKLPEEPQVVVLSKS